MEDQNLYGCLHLKYLAIVNSKLIDNVAVKLMRGLRNSIPDLKELDLSKNKIGDNSCKILGDFASNAYSLNKINLKWNIISSKGAIPLLEGIF